VLKQNGVSVAIMTGDNQYVTQQVARDVGLPADRVIIGNQVDRLDDAALAYQAENGANDGVIEGRRCFANT